MIRQIIVYSHYDAPAPAYGCEVTTRARRVAGRVSVPEPALGPNAKENRAAQDRAWHIIQQANEPEVALLGDGGEHLPRRAWKALFGELFGQKVEDA